MDWENLWNYTIVPYGTALLGFLVFVVIIYVFITAMLDLDYSESFRPANGFSKRKDKKFKDRFMSVLGFTDD